MYQTFLIPNFYPLNVFKASLAPPVSKREATFSNTRVFFPKKFKPVYSEHQVIADTFFRNRRCPL